MTALHLHVKMRFAFTSCDCLRCVSSSVSLCAYVFVLQARIKKIMQTDEEIGKVAAAVPVIICILKLSVVFSYPDFHML